MKSKEKIHLHPAVFFRKYGEKVIVYHTGDQKVFVFNETAGALLSALQVCTDMENVLQALELEYDIGDKDEFRGIIGEFVDELMAKNIVQKEYQQIEKEYSLESEISSALSNTNLLYSATLPYCIVSGNNVNRKMISEAVQLDRLSYEDKYQVQVETCYDYFEKNKDIYIMAVENENKHVIGYINFSPVSKSIFEEMISGRTADTIITGDDLLSYQKKGLYWGYFSSIVVHPDYRQLGVATKMLQCWSKLLLNLATRRGIFFRKIVADAVSDVGIHLLSQMGFEFLRPSMHESSVMLLDLFSVQPKNNSVISRKLVETYNCFIKEGGETDVL